MADLDGLEVKYVGNRFVADWNGVTYTDTNAGRLVETVGNANSEVAAVDYVVVDGVPAEPLNIQEQA